MRYHLDVDSQDMPVILLGLKVLAEQVHLSIETGGKKASAIDCIDALRLDLLRQRNEQDSYMSHIR